MGCILWNCLYFSGGNGFYSGFIRKTLFMNFNFFKYTSYKRQYLGFNDSWVILIGLILMGLLVPVIFFRTTHTSIGITEILESTVYSAVYWFSNRWMYIELRKRYPHVQQAKKRILLQLILSTIIALIVGPLFYPFHLGAAKLFNYEIIRPTAAEGISASLVLTYLILAVYESIYFYTQLKKSIEEKEAVKRLHLQSKWEGLRNQVNPHFLFNSLNTLLNIVHQDVQQAEQFIKKLSKVYRFILESRNDPLIPLKEELELAKSYAFLQEERFKPNLNIKFDILPESEDQLIVPLALQILIENTIKHNIISKKKPLTVKLFTTDQPHHQIVVENNLQRKRQVLDSTKVGLENLKKRYQLFSKQAVQVAADDHHFVVTLPLLQNSQTTKNPCWSTMPNILIMNIVIIEDEFHAVERLRALIKKIRPNFVVQTVLDSVEDAVDWFASNPIPDLIFMDVQLADGLSFEIFQHIKLTVPIIFTTHLIIMLLKHSKLIVLIIY